MVASMAKRWVAVMVVLTDATWAESLAAEKDVMTVVVSVDSMVAM